MIKRLFRNAEILILGYLAILGLLMPVYALATDVTTAADNAGGSCPANQLWPCCNTFSQDANGNYIPTSRPCDIVALGELANNLLKFMVMISVPLAAVLFAYAGVLYLSAAGSESQIRKAHSIFSNVLIGFVLVLTAWLIVDFIMNQLATPGSYVHFLNKN